MICDTKSNYDDTSLILRYLTLLQILIDFAVMAMVEGNELQR